MTDVSVNSEDVRLAVSGKALSINSDDSCIGYSETEDDEPALDPKHLNLVHEELEKLNIATDVINKLEVQLDGARAQFRETHNDWAEKLKELSKKYSSAIAKARPFYEAKLQERKIRDESQQSAIRFERATSILHVAKTQVSFTQDSISRQKVLQPDCLEVLNHHIQRVSEAENERLAAEDEHRKVSARMLELAEQIPRMEKEHRSAIKKSRTYYDRRLEFTRVLEHQKELILRLEAEVRQKKCDYTTSLRNLEKISDSIHEQRSIGGQSAREIRDTAPANPPPYLPTAPPPYEDDSRYMIEEEKDEVIDPVMCMISEAVISGDLRGERPRSLHSGVILLAQQLLGNGDKDRHHHEPTMIFHSEEADIDYRTRPECILSSPSESESSSIASVRTSGVPTDDEAITGMLRSHSTLIQEIEFATDRVGSMLKRSVSDAESGIESNCGRLYPVQ